MNIILLIAAYFFMEFVAWFSHKYIMHGFLWKWHKDHHVHDFQEPHEYENDKGFEKNDLFFLIYAIPAIILLITGITFKMIPLIYIGIGISLYGLTYFTIHDIMIHRRVNIPFLMNPDNFYIKAVLRAHTAHHWAKSKKEFSNYGLLIFPLRYFKK